MEAEHFTSQTANGDQNWTLVTNAGASGASSNNALQALPNVGAAYPTLDPTAARVEYQIVVPDGAAGDYYVHLRDVGATSSDDSVYVSVDANTTTSAVVTAGRTLDWKTSNVKLTFPAGTHVLTVWMREDGVVIDKIVADGTSTAPVGFGPSESSRESAETPPAIAMQPASQTVTVGDAVTFNVVATGDPAPTFQWQKDGADIPNATDATLTLGSATTENAGDYSVVVSNTAGSITSGPATLTVNKAYAGVTFGETRFVYDGSPHFVSVATSPSGLAVAVTYNGHAQPPTLPGSYAVGATIMDANYQGSATTTIVIGVTALVQHAPVLNGTLDGSLQLLGGESFALNGSANVTGDVLVPGEPAIQINGNPVYGGTLDAAGAADPASYQITLNGAAAVRHIVRRVDALPMPAVSAPAAPAGTRDVALNQPGESAGDFSTLRDLTLNANVGAVPVFPGVYGNFSASAGSSFILGIAGTTEPAAYDLQRLTLNGGARLEIVGPVVLTLANGATFNGDAGTDGHSEWLTLRIATGGVTLNGGVTLTGRIVAPAGAVMINGGSRVVGSVVCDRLSLMGGAVAQ
jgi:rhamnogalacturonan endolyase